MEKDYVSLVREIFEKRDTPPLCCVHSYGCQQNVNDGERLTGQLCEMGCGVTADMEEADII
ncbi:MAG: tRNA (N6-isopentenyl adenosine(37)-C2)-methylthiotransferase MiaB, partial [Oscillospiraceae bacterium]|nr:tRNA (N6-isopentenyl adenosine(37)-C2)-methylthiotransferase MiaB [Oscillospiraceae bacterium]